MPRYVVTLTPEERVELEKLIQKGGKGYRIKHAQILLKLDRREENAEWGYEKIKEAYHTSNSTIAGVAKRFVMDGLEAALGRKKQENHYLKVTGEVEASICTIACSDAPEGKSRWTIKQLIQETRIPCEPGKTEKVDSEYVRNGVADVFMIFEGSEK